MHAALVDGLVDMPRQILTGDWQILLLDTTVTGSNAGHLADSELTELDAALAAAPARPALICLHHNPIPVGSTWLDTMAIDNGAALLAIIDRHPQVRGVLWGHVHQQFDADRNGVRLLASPSTCVQFLPGSHDFALDDAAPGYRVLTLHPDGRIDSHVERLADYTVRIDRQAGGY
jgi:Icc protein